MKRGEGLAGHRNGVCQVGELASSIVCHQKQEGAGSNNRSTILSPGLLSRYYCFIS